MLVIKPKVVEGHYVCPPCGNGLVVIADMKRVLLERGKPYMCSKDEDTTVLECFQCGARWHYNFEVQFDESTTLELILESSLK